MRIVWVSKLASKSESTRRQLQSMYLHTSTLCRLLVSAFVIPNPIQPRGVSLVFDSAHVQSACDLKQVIVTGERK